MKYMSEVFLELLGNDFSTENVRQGTYGMS